MWWWYGGDSGVGGHRGGGRGIGGGSGGFGGGVMVMAVVVTAFVKGAVVKYSDLVCALHPETIQQFVASILGRPLVVGILGNL